MSPQNKELWARIWRECIGPPRVGFWTALDRLIDASRAEGAESVAYHKGQADTWRGIAAAMGYEPKAHLNVRPSQPWLLERIAKYRAQVIANADIAERQPEPREDQYMVAAPGPRPMVSAGEATASALGITVKDAALHRARPFVADTQAPWDHEARELLQVIDQAIGGPVTRLALPFIGHVAFVALVSAFIWRAF